jgi:small-conductance mechanosensitive channel
MVAKESTELISFLTALAVFVTVSGLALGLRHVSFRVLHRWATTKPSLMTGIIIRSLRVPSVAWCLLIGIYIAVDQAHLPPKPSLLALNVVYVLLVLSVTAAVANLSGAILEQALADRNLPIPATGLSFTIVKVAVWVLGGLVLLSSLGVSITPILTALGVGGLAVALALQETLSNFFAGVHLLLSRPIRVGDFVKLETGQEGYVADIGWRATKLRMLPNNIVVVPNSKMAQSILINYSLPEPRMAVSITIGASYGEDPDHIERLLLEETMKAAPQVPGLLVETAPTVRFIPGFGESSLNFTLTCHVRGFEDQFLAQHELRKRILKRFRDERIEIPFPQRTVHLVGGAEQPPVDHHGQSLAKNQPKG